MLSSSEASAAASSSASTDSSSFVSTTLPLSSSEVDSSTTVSVDLLEDFLVFLGFSSTVSVTSVDVSTATSAACSTTLFSVVSFAIGGLLKSFLSLSI